MESLTSIEPRMLVSLRGLKLRALRIVEGYVAGLHRSPYRGFSTEFAEHREYVPGDDLRYVDWKVYGRSDKVYLKQFADETNLICYLALDISESMTYRGPSSALSKLEYAQCLAAAIAWLVLKQQDAVALATFDSEIRSLARGGAPSHLDPIVSAIESALPGKRTSAGPIFRELAKRWVKRGVVVVISDCLDDLASLVKGLHHFRHRPHDVILLHVLGCSRVGISVSRADAIQRPRKLAQRRSGSADNSRDLPARSQRVFGRLWSTNAVGSRSIIFYCGPTNHSTGP